MSQQAGADAAQQTTDQRAPARANNDALARVAGLLQRVLEQQAEALGADAGVVVLVSGGAHAGSIAARTPQNIAPATADALAKLAHGARSSREPEVHDVRADSRGGMYTEQVLSRAITIPMGAGERTEAVCALGFVRSEPVSTDTGRLRALGRAVAAPFEASLWRQHALDESSHKQLLRETIEIMDAAGKGEDTRTMASILTDELRRRFDCVRVGVGLVRGPAGAIKLTSVSGSEAIDSKSEASEALEHAMEECAMQDAAVVYPAPAEEPPEDARVVRAHESLSQRFGPSSVVSLPLRVRGDLVGVLTLEREKDAPFPSGAIALLRLAAELAGPALWTRRLADRTTLQVAADNTLEIGSWLVGPRHTGWKLFGLVMIALVLLSALVPIPRRVTADAEIRASIARTVVPPFTGVLDETLVRPGDRVEEGVAIAQMEISELQIQLAPLRARLAERRLERDSAELVDPAAATAADLAMREIQTQIDVIEDRIRRSTILAPIDGVISRGDLRDFVGARVDPTQPLFELVGDGRIVVIEVDERAVARGLVEIGTSGWISSRARPGTRVPIEVTRVNPVAEAVSGKNIYRAEAVVVGGSDVEWLRPGETGIVKLRAGSTTVLGAVFGPIADEMRLRLWW